MTVLSATQEQFDNLNGYANGIHILRFSTDGSGGHVLGLNVLTDIAFIGVLPQLQQLTPVEYTPPPTDNT